MNKRFGYGKQGAGGVYRSPRTGAGFSGSSIYEAPASAKPAVARRTMMTAEVYSPTGIAQQAYRRTMATEQAKGRSTYMNPTRPYSADEFDRARISSSVKQNKLMNKMYRQRFK